MKNIIIVNASARNERSISRYMASVFIELWQRDTPDDMFIFREVVQGNIPHVTEKWINARQFKK